MKKKYLTKFNTSMRKTWNKSIEEKYLNIIKVIYEQLTVNIFSGERLKTLKIRDKAKMPTFITSIQHSIGSTS